MKHCRKLVLAYGWAVTIPFQAQEPANEVHKNGMNVTWRQQDKRIHIEMQAPTEGWVAIGFNTSTSITGTYLVMGRVVNGQAEVQEHYTVKPGHYPSFKTLDVPLAVADVSGQELKGRSTIRFSLPVSALHRYAKNLSKGQAYVLVLAYSVSDAFDHHSRMRTSTRVTL